jgi:hypothetical protein
VSVHTDAVARRIVVRCMPCDIELAVDLRGAEAGLALMRFSLEHDHANGLDREFELARLDMELPPRR